MPIWYPNLKWNFICTGFLNLNFFHIQLFLKAETRSCTKQEFYHVKAWSGILLSFFKLSHKSGKTNILLYLKLVAGN